MPAVGTDGRMVGNAAVAAEEAGPCAREHADRAVAVARHALGAVKLHVGLHINFRAVALHDVAEDEIPLARQRHALVDVEVEIPADQRRACAAPGDGEVLEHRRAAEADIRRLGNVEYGVCALADNGEALHIGRQRHAVVVKGQRADDVQGDVGVCRQAVDGVRQIGDGVVLGARAERRAAVGCVDIGEAEALNLGHAIKDGVVDLLCHVDIAVHRGVDVVRREERAGLCAFVGERIEVDEGVFAGVGRVQRVGDFLLRGADEGRGAQRCHIGRHAVYRVGDVHLRGLGVVADRFDKVGVEIDVPLLRAVGIARGIGVVGAEREDVPIRAGLGAGQAVGKRVGVVDARRLAHRHAARGKPVVGNERILALLHQPRRDARGIGLRGKGSAVALGDAVADGDDAQRLGVALRRAVHLVEAPHGDAAERAGHGQRRLGAAARVGLDRRGVENRARLESGRTGNGHIEVAAHDLRVADLLLIRRDHPAVKAAARNVDFQVAVDGIILFVGGGQRRVARCAHRDQPDAPLHEDRHMEGAARDVQRGVVGENHLPRHRKAVVLLVVGLDIVGARRAEGAALNRDGQRRGDCADEAVPIRAKVAAAETVERAVFHRDGIGQLGDVIRVDAALRRLGGIDAAVEPEARAGRRLRHRKLFGEGDAVEAAEDRHGRGRRGVNRQIKGDHIVICVFGKGDALLLHEARAALRRKGQIAALFGQRGLRRHRHVADEDDGAARTVQRVDRRRKAAAGRRGRLSVSRAAVGNIDARLRRACRKHQAACRKQQRAQPKQVFFHPEPP